MRILNIIALEASYRKIQSRAVKLAGAPSDAGWDRVESLVETGN